MKKIIDLSGMRFGLWTVMGKSGNTKGGAAIWSVLCDCGATKGVIGADLRNGKSKSCGCVSRLLIGKRSTTHGQSNTRLHTIWKNMRARCYRESYPQWEYYGGRGIGICEDWDDFKSFMSWANNNGYRDDLSIERKDVNGSYSPENCTWANAATQSANRRFVSRRGDGVPWVRIARENGITTNQYYWRKRSGMTAEEAATPT